MNITTAALQRLLDLLDPDLTHIALDAGTPTEAGLENEHYRAQLAPAFRDGNTTVREIYLDETQGNGHTGGFVLLANATDTPGTGILFSFEDAVNVDKSERDSLTISVELTLEVGT